MDRLEDLATLVGAVASLIAAGLWLWASMVSMPPFPSVGLDSNPTVFEPVRTALRHSSRINAWAAFFSGVAALAATIAFGAHHYMRGG